MKKLLLSLIVVAGVTSCEMEHHEHRTPAPTETPAPTDTTNPNR